MTKPGRSRRISPPQRKLFLTIVVGLLVLGALVGLYYSPVGKALFGLAVAVPQSEVYYSFDSGGANSGTLRNIRSATIPREVNCADVGVLGNGCEFPGTADGFVTLPPEILNGKTDFSMSFWMRLSGGRKIDLFSSRAADGGAIPFDVFINPNFGRADLLIIVNGFEYQFTGAGGSGLIDNTWHQMVLTRSTDGPINLFIDGDQKDVEELGGFARGPIRPIASNSFVLGLQLGSDHFHTSTFDELRFYDRGLTDGEVTDLYNEGIVQCGEEITKSRTLINDVDCRGQDTDALRLSADNVILDCDKQANGITAQQDYQGIIISGRRDVTVRDCQVEGANVGISVRNSQGVRLENNKLTNNNEFGISLIGTSGSGLIGNRLNENTQGINVEDSGADGQNIIQKNLIFDSTGNGITLRNSQRTIIGGEDAEEGNTLEDNNYGIHLTASTPNNVILNNALTNNRETSITLISGVVGDSTVGSDINRVEHNNIRGSKKGVYISRSVGNMVKDNDIQGTREMAIHIDAAGGNTLQANVVSDSLRGLFLQNVGENTRIKQNDVCHNTVDIFCEGTLSPVNEQESVENSFGGREPGSGIECAGQDWPIERVHYFSCIENPNDSDGDGPRDTRDNCPAMANADQLDTDRDGVGDVCDEDIDGDALCNKVAGPKAECNGAEDKDGNGVYDPNGADKTPGTADDETNPLDPDTDGDTICDGDPGKVITIAGKTCSPGHSPDNCPTVQNVDQHNTDGVADGGDACDDDDDNDGRPDRGLAETCSGPNIINRCNDNCRVDPNADQLDFDGDRLGDVCDADDDNDILPDDRDNCQIGDGDGLYEPEVDQNTDNQTDIDSDGNGDLCDVDKDGDQVANDQDNCPAIPNAGIDPDGPGFQLPPAGDDVDSDGFGDACDDDDDADDIPDGRDNCPAAANPGQEDLNRNRIGDVCDNDQDGDGVLEANDNCPRDRNADQLNTDGQNDGGDACDGDDDNDSINDVDENGRPLDNCPQIENNDQLDTNEDGVGDLCDDDDDGDGTLDLQDVFDTDANEQTDTDADGVGDNADNCLIANNNNQLDTDNDGVGDACDNCRDVDNGGLTRSQCLSNENGFLAGLCQQVDTNSNNIGDACEAVVQVSTLSMNSLDDLNNLDTRLVGGRVVSVEERRQLPQSGLASGPQSCVAEDCFAFDGQDYIEIRDERLKVKRVTISVWARSDINGSRYATEAYLFNKKSGDRIGTYALGVDPGTDKMKFTIRTDQGTSYSVSALDSLDTQWHHYVTRFDGFELGLYVDGELSRRIVIDQSNILLNVTGPLRIGSRPDGVSFWRGRMDELQVHDGAMDHDAIVGLYTNQNDRDSDGIVTRDDNCPAVENADQRDSDHDGIGNACDSDVDVDGDGVPNEEDNCPAVQNPNQEDLNEDSIGDACQGGAGQPCNVDRTCAEGLACSVAARCATDNDGDAVADDDEPASCRQTPAGRKVYTNGCLIGDVNADRCVNDVDVTGLARSLRTHFVRSTLCVAPNRALTEQDVDLNKDGCVNLRDVVILSQALRTSFNRQCQP